MPIRLWMLLVPSVAAFAFRPSDSAAQAPAEKLPQLRIEVADDAGRPTPCRIHLFDPDGKPVQPAGLPFWRDHFVFPGRVALPLRPGKYRYEIERGPEHSRAAGTVELKADADAGVSVKLRRIADLRKLGWWSGDLHVHRPVKDVELLMQAEDLHVAPVITWWNKTNLWAGREAPKDPLRRFDGDRVYHLMGGEDERGGGALLYFGLDAPLPITQAAREHPSSPAFAVEARKRDPKVWIDAEKPFWWDFPIWVSSGLLNSVGVANNHMCRSTVLATEAWGRPRDKARLPDPHGNGLWTQEIYHHLLNCGVRLPPSAGSASGVLPNPVGYNRVFVQMDGQFDHAQWWAGLAAGRSFVTNGPLLLCRADGRPPGHVFTSAAAPLEIKLELTLISNDRVPKMEIVKNGRVEAVIDLADGVEQSRSAVVTFAESGWFQVRAIAENKQTFRFAATAPYWVEIGDKKTRVSRASADFFLTWLKERTERIEREPMPDDARREVLLHHAAARRFWEDVRARATVD